jgi:hypothetical protein
MKREKPESKDSGFFFLAFGLWLLAVGCKL